MFFSAAHGTFSKTDYILGQKASFNKYRKTEIIPWAIHNRVRLMSTTGKSLRYNLMETKQHTTE